MNFPHEMDSLAIIWGVVFLAFSLWFLKRNRSALSCSAIIRHFVFVAIVFAGCLWLLYGGWIANLMFGRVIHKGQPEETWAVLIRLGGVILFFALAAISLGNNRVQFFKRYLNSFKKHIDVPK
jgi:uncharacterized protein with PQ loop repeat